MDKLLLNEFIRLKKENNQLKLEIESMKPKVVKEINSHGGKLKFNDFSFSSKVFTAYEFSDEIYNLRDTMREMKLAEIESGRARILEEKPYVMLRAINSSTQYKSKSSTTATTKDQPISKQSIEKPSKHGRAWTDEENEELLSLWNQGKSSLEISKTILRKSSAVIARLVKLKVVKTELEIEIMDRERKGLSVEGYLKYPMTTRPDDPRLIALPKNKQPKTDMAGTKWTSKLDSELVEDWQKELELIPLLKKYGRTPNAIFLRLSRLGLITEEMNPYATYRRY